MSLFTKLIRPLTLNVSLAAVLNSTSPATSKLCLILVVPDTELPKLMVVAAPKALIVVALVLNKANPLSCVVSPVTNAGRVLNTADPLPVGSLSVPLS